MEAILVAVVVIAVFAALFYLTGLSLGEALLAGVVLFVGGAVALLIAGDRPSSEERWFP